MLPSIEQRLALELSAKPVQVAAAIALLDEGATVPFIARYRKEATGGLADALLNDPSLNPEEEAAKFIKPAFTTDNGDNPGVPDAKAALDGARQILMERFAEDATLLQSLREYLTDHGVVESKVSEGKQVA